jgi:hypothetical protein
MKLVKKAWLMDISFIREPWFASCLEEPIHAGTQGEARSIAFSILKHENCTDSEHTSLDEVKYTDVKVKRYPEADKFETEDGEVMPKWRIEERNKDRKRREDLKQMVVCNPGRYVYIRKNGQYYKEGYCGYTDFRHRAGVYTIKDAVDNSLHCRDLDVVLIDKDQHNKMILEEIASLQRKYIPDCDIPNLPIEM